MSLKEPTELILLSLFFFVAFVFFVVNCIL